MGIKINFIQKPYYNHQNTLNKIADTEDPEATLNNS